MGQPDLVRSYCPDQNSALVCYPRPCDSAAFYLGRDNLRSFRSKQTQSLIDFLLTQPRAVVMCTHRHSVETLRRVLPPGLHLATQMPLFGSAKFGPEGLCYLAVIERR
jgi:hypothetical protein